MAERLDELPARLAGSPDTALTPSEKVLTASDVVACLAGAHQWKVGSVE
jgi:hypothetical protein